MKPPSENHCPESFYKANRHSFGNAMSHSNFFPNHEIEVCAQCGMVRINLAYDARASQGKRPPSGVDRQLDRWAYFKPMAVDK